MRAFPDDDVRLDEEAAELEVLCRFSMMGDAKLLRNCVGRRTQEHPMDTVLFRRLTMLFPSVYPTSIFDLICLHWCILLMPHCSLGLWHRISVMVCGIRLYTVFSLTSQEQWARMLVPGRGWNLLALPKGPKFLSSPPPPPGLASASPPPPKDLRPESKARTKTKGANFLRRSRSTFTSYHCSFVLWSFAAALAV